MRWRTAIAMLLGVLGAAGCAERADTSVDHVDADVVFNQEMITHHQQTIRLAEVAAERGESSYVRDLSRKLIAEEKADIAMMSSWLRSWREPVPPEPATRPGADLPAGPGFDGKWLATLSGHLEHGVHMAETVKKTGRHGPTLELADAITKAQRAEMADVAGRAG